MSIRSVPRRVVALASAIALAGTAAAVWLFVLPAGAQPTSGSNIPGAAAPIGSYPPGTPFSSGQTIQVSVPANDVLTPGAAINILECSDSGGTAANNPTSVSDCDGRTVQGDSVLVNSDGSVSYDNYTVYALPDALTLGESSTHTPVCNTDNYCVLYIGQDQNDFTQPHFFSQPFLVAANGDDSGANPGDGAGPAAAVGTSFSYTSSPMSWAGLTPTMSVVGSLPHGLTWADNHNGTVTISGTPSSTPDSAGYYEVGIEATFEASSSSRSTYYNPNFSKSVTVHEEQPYSLSVAQAPSFTDSTYTLTETASTSSPAVTHTLDYTVTTHEGWPTDPIFTATGLPSGIYLTNNHNGTATLSGPLPVIGKSDPKTVDTYTVDLTVTNGFGSPGTETLTLNVDGAYCHPVSATCPAG